MLKLETILVLEENINTQRKLLETLRSDYLDLIDDDLYTVDFTAEPCFVDDFRIAFTTRFKLKQKYLLRFCSDFGLSLVSETEIDNGHYEYLFECED